MNKIIELKGIKKMYLNGNKEIEVLRKIDIEVKKGDSILILGPSGSGKTTLLNIMGLLDKQTSGDIYFYGENVLNKKEKELSYLRNKKIGFIFQFHHLFPEFTALENVILAGLISGRKKKELEHRAMKLLEEFSLEDRAGYYPWQLSGGEQQRVAVLRAVFNEPDILLCDEPTGDLDREMAEKVMFMLKNFNEKGISLVIVSHNILLTEITRKTIFLRNGILEER